MAAIVIFIAAAWHSPAHADGGASARSQTTNPAANPPDTPQARAQRILRSLADRHSNNWVRYWQARADCEAAAVYKRRRDNPPIDRVLLTLTAAICARLEARLGVNPADYAPRGEERGEGLVASEPGAAVGYTLFNVWYARNIYLIDPLGRVAHIWRLDDILPGRTAYYAKLLNNGNLMLLANSPREIFEIDPRGNILWRYIGIDRLHHDFIKMPNGNVMMLVEGIKTREQAIAAGANPDFVSERGLEYDYLVEVRPTDASGGEIVWQWSPWDHLVQDFDPTKPNYDATAKHPELIDLNFPPELNKRRPDHNLDWLHTNAIDYNHELDQIMLSPRHFSELWVIDHSATMEEARGHSGGNSGMGGDLLYRWGNPRAYGRGDADDQRLFWQHQTQWIAPGLPGAGNILVFNNGNEFKSYLRGYSSVDEIVPPVDGYGYRRDANSPYLPAEPTWTYAAETPSDFYAALRSGAQRLPNGNTLVVHGPAGIIFQVTPEGRTVWKYIVPRHYHISLWQREGAPARLTFGVPNDYSQRTVIRMVYRAYWYPPDYPALQALDIKPGARIEDYRDLFDWIRAGIAAGDFGQPLAHSDFDVYLDENILIYFKRPCAAEDTRARLFLRIIPADARDLPDHRWKYGFDDIYFGFNRSGNISGNWCVAIRRLPDYPIRRIRTGQSTPAGELWRAEITLNE